MGVVRDDGEGIDARLPGKASKEPKKDVTNDEMLRGAVSKQRSVDIRMGEPTAFKRAVRESEVTQGTETSKYL